MPHSLTPRLYAIFRKKLWNMDWTLREEDTMDSGFFENNKIYQSSNWSTNRYRMERFNIEIWKRMSRENRFWTWRHDSNDAAWSPSSLSSRPNKMVRLLFAVTSEVPYWRQKSSDDREKYNRSHRIPNRTARNDFWKRLIWSIVFHGWRHALRHYLACMRPYSEACLWGSKCNCKRSGAFRFSTSDSRDEAAASSRDCFFAAAFARWQHCSESFESGV